MSLKAKLEAVIYAAEEPVTLAQLAALFSTDALEWKAEQEAASAAIAAEQAAEAADPLPLLNAAFDYADLEPAAEAAAPEAEAAPAEAGEEQLAAPEGDASAATGTDAVPEAGGEAASTEAAAELAAVDAEAEAKRLARQRDREVRVVLRGLLDELMASYASDDRGIEIREIAGGFRMATKPECHDAVAVFVKSLKPAMKLCLPALETLAVIAYKQPVTAPEVNEIRGVDSSGVLGSLLARKLIATAGRKQVIGRPILYKTTKEFLLRFGLKDVSELPSMEEFEKMARLSSTRRIWPAGASRRRMRTSFRKWTKIWKRRRGRGRTGPAGDRARERDRRDGGQRSEPGRANRPRPRNSRPARRQTKRRQPPQRPRLLRLLTWSRQKLRMSQMSDEQRSDANEDELNETPETSETPKTEVENPIEAEAAAEAEDEADAETEAEDEAETKAQEEAAATEDETEPEFKPKARPPAKLERLQKILAAAGVASRRKAEEMMEQGRVQVNGKVVTELGTKADAGRDHIRVDGKLLQGAERLRYFVLNKPKGFVTTVKDPEGRPTVMQFFDKMRERLYPVGRLDYMSEGLLLVTNDGELANKLTRASAGVEKTYLVKVAGIPSEGELDILRSGVAIEKGKPGSAKVRTSPARIRQVRQGDNPWYEVVLIEGRNRELRKMFEEIGHFVEKIRRVGYGPLILDQEPGHLRELDAQELELLRKAADGKLKTPKAKEMRRRNIVDSLPPEKPALRPRGEKPAAGPKDYKPKRAFGTDAPARARTGPAKFGAGRPAGGPAGRPAWKKDDRAGAPPARFGAGAAGEGRPAAGRSYGDRPATGRTYGDKPAGRTYGAKPGAGRPFGERPAARRSFPAKPAWKKPEAGERPPYKRPAAPRPEPARRPAPEPMEDLGPKKPSRLHIEPVQDFGRTERPRMDRPRTERPSTGRPPSGRPAFGRAGAERSSGGRSSSARPFRGEGGLARPFTTSSGKPRVGGPRPSSKPGKPGGRTYGAGAGRGSGSSAGPAKRPVRRDEGGGPAASRPSRPYTPRGEGAEGFRPERKTGSGWKPKPNFAGKSKTGASDRSRPKAGGFSKSGAKRKPGGGKPGGSGAKRSGPRPGGKRP